jgi:hypothetical protein
MSATRYAIERAPAGVADLLDMMAPALMPLPKLTKRATWALDELIAAGPAGISKIDFPGVNLGDAVLKCRKAGVVIETLHEAHGGEFAGHHGRYVLRSRVVRLPEAAPIGATAATEHRATP